MSKEQKFIDEVEDWIGGNIAGQKSIDWMSLTRFLRATLQDYTASLSPAAVPAPTIWLSDRCPNCKSRLFVGDGGWITCSGIPCNTPGLEEMLKSAVPSQALPAMPQDELIRALEPIAQEIINTGNEYKENDWNPDAHIEKPITLTIREARAVLNALSRAKSARGQS